MKLTIHIRVMSRLRDDTAVPQLPSVTSWRGQGRIYLYLSNVGWESVDIVHLAQGWDGERGSMKCTKYFLTD